MAERDGKKFLGEYLSEHGLLVKIYAPDPPLPDDELERRKKRVATITATGALRALDAAAEEKREPEPRPDQPARTEPARTKRTKPRTRRRNQALVVKTEGKLREWGEMTSAEKELLRPHILAAYQSVADEAVPTPPSSGSAIDVARDDMAAGDPRPKRPRIQDARHALILASAWRSEIDEGAITKAGIAQREGLSRARITQVMRLLDLDGEVQRGVMDAEVTWSIKRALGEVEHATRSAGTTKARGSAPG